MVWVNPPNRCHYNFVGDIPQSSTPRMHKMFNHDVDHLLQKKFFFRFLMLMLLLEINKHEEEKEQRVARQLRLRRAASTLCSSPGALAQLVRAPPCHGGGCGFEPRRLRIVSVNVAAAHI
jgi:hypothetical protein